MQPSRVPGNSADHPCQGQRGWWAHPAPISHRLWAVPKGDENPQVPPVLSSRSLRSVHQHRATGPGGWHRRHRRVHSVGRDTQGHEQSSHSISEGSPCLPLPPPPPRTHSSFHYGVHSDVTGSLYQNRFPSSLITLSQLTLLVSSWLKSLSALVLSLAGLFLGPPGTSVLPGTFQAACITFDLLLFEYARVCVCMTECVCEYGCVRVYD